LCVALKIETIADININLHDLIFKFLVSLKWNVDDLPTNEPKYEAKNESIIASQERKQDSN
jgi:hypothetical protein